MSISRRDALMGATAAAVVTGALTAPLAIRAALASEPDDAVLLSRIEQFHDVYDAQNRVWEKQQAHRAEIEARPDCPALDPATSSHAYIAFLEANDAFRYCPESERLHEQIGPLVTAVFETPAQTAQGVLGKVRIMYLARGDFDQQGDEALEVFQDDRNSPWFGAVIADLERLAGEARS